MIEEYEQSLKYYRDLKNSFDTATEEGFEKGFKKGIEQALEQGRKKGLEQGLEKGIEQGLEKGIEQGFEQGRNVERKAFAKKLLAQKMPPANVAEIIGLSLEEVQLLSHA